MLLTFLAQVWKDLLSIASSYQRSERIIDAVKDVRSKDAEIDQRWKIAATDRRFTFSLPGKGLMQSFNMQKSARAVLDYGWDLTAWLEGDTIASASWSVPHGLVQVGEVVKDNLRAVKVSGGKVGSSYTLSLLITTVTSRITEEFRINLAVL